MASSKDVKIKLYWLEQSRSQRILWLLEELQLPYDIEIFHRDNVTMLADPELKKAHPLGKSPVISISYPGSSEPLVIAESGFIIEYLLDHFSQGKSLLPKRYENEGEDKCGSETEEWLRYRYFLHYAEGSLMTLLMQGLFTIKIQKTPLPFFLKFITNFIAGKIRSSYLDANYKIHFSFLESQLSTSPNDGKYLCGPNLTGADILMSFPLISAVAASSTTGLTQANYPKLYCYIKALEEEPGYKRAIEKIIQIEGEFKSLL